LPRFFNPHPFRRGKIAFDFVRHAALDFAILNRGQPVAVHGHVHVGRIVIQRLPDDQAGFAMRLSARSRNSMSEAIATSLDICFQT